MSKNFELMQRAGRLLEIDPVPDLEVTVAPPATAPLPLLDRAQTEDWTNARSGLRSEMDKAVREEALRLVQQIFMLPAQQPVRAVVFAGVEHGNGCSTICAETARVLQAYVRRSVCLVEANFRSPSLPELFGTTNHFGLTDALVGEGPIRSFAKPVPKGSLWLLSSGAPVADSQGLLSSSRMKGRFQELQSEFDFVIVDAPPLARYADAVALGRMADGLVLVLEANSTRREAALRISDHLRANQIRLLGAVLNKRTFPIPESLYRLL
jgi:Mrp family chromosome partitioning ATPase